MPVLNVIFMLLAIYYRADNDFNTWFHMEHLSDYGYIIQLMRILNTIVYEADTYYVNVDTNIQIIFLVN